MANTFKYQEVFTKEYQKSNYVMPVYPVIADLQFSAGLKIGDTVTRRYRNNPIFAQDLSSSGGYTPQNYSEAEDQFTISKQKEASVRIVNTEVLHTDLDVAKSYGRQLAQALYQQIDADTLGAAYSGAGSTIDDGSFSGGTSGNGLTVGIGNVSDIPTIAMEKFIGNNVVYNNNLRFGKVAYDDYGGMLTWIIPPQVWTQIQKYLMSRGTPLGDRVTTNGYKGTLGDFELFVSNNLPYSASFALVDNPTNGDTVTVNGVTFTFKTATAANGDIKILGTAALTNASLKAALAAPTTAITGGTDYDPFVDGTDTTTHNGYTVNKSSLLRNLTSTDNTTSTAIVMRGWGKVTVSQSMTSASNLWTAAKQCVHSILMVAKNISLAVRKDPTMYENPVSNSVARDYVMWTVYDNKVFTDQARAIIDLAVRCDGSDFTSYSTVQA